MKKIGLGIVTYNREEYCKQVIDKILPNVFDTIVLVNDASPYTFTVPDYIHSIVNVSNMGVGRTKNVCFKYLMEMGCDYIFILEDDILLNDLSVIEKYIKLHERTGIHHFNYGFHGPANKINGEPKPKVTIKYKDEPSLIMNHNCVGAFSFYTKKCLEACGLMNETYINAMEHVSHTYTIAQKGMTTPFWYFADLYESYNYIDEIECSEKSSVIRFTPNWKSNIINGYNKFVEIHGHGINKIPTEINFDKLKFQLNENLKRYMDGRSKT